MKIDLVAWGDAIGGLSLEKSEANGSLVAMSFQYSKAVNYSGPPLMEIHKSGNGGIPARAEASEEDKKHELMPLIVEEKKGDPDAQGKKTPLQIELENRRKESPTLVALVPLPVNCRRATVLLAPSEGGTFLAYVIDDDPSKLPVGQLRIHNLSAYPIGLRCNGKETKELKIRDTMLVAAPEQQCIYEIACKDTEEWRIIENNIIPVRANEQTQMIILKSRNQYFLSADGSSGGFLQTVILRRRPEAPAVPTP
ncbi:MAG: hypothetical protein RI957_1402 [Verrucomicrobiota bacterium]